VGTQKGGYREEGGRGWVKNVKGEKHAPVFSAIAEIEEENVRKQGHVFDSPGVPIKGS